MPMGELKKLIDVFIACRRLGKTTKWIDILIISIDVLRNAACLIFHCRDVLVSI